MKRSKLRGRVLLTDGISVIKAAHELVKVADAKGPEEGEYQSTSGCIKVLEKETQSTAQEKSPLRPPSQSPTSVSVKNTINFVCLQCCRQCCVTFEGCVKDWYLNEIPENPDLHILDNEWAIPLHQEGIRCASAVIRQERESGNSATSDKRVWIGSQLYWPSLSAEEQSALLVVKDLIDIKGCDIMCADTKWVEKYVDHGLVDAMKVSAKKTRLLFDNAFCQGGQFC